MYTKFQATNIAGTVDWSESLLWLVVLKADSVFILGPNLQTMIVASTKAQAEQ